ncbi:hypothetical protein D9758_004441 [Tetrapyrgos nigripes]|uniref:AAA+ ATPase domain-containing protein n=1 Tax=Tetrapyrgos nigripes TaxID=182062 RepID=A0A8H5GNM2_9AGAR|nr:hypothetical protein D9758_004441 [Tetrapyrgos nigripes]
MNRRFSSIIGKPGASSVFDDKASTIDDASTIKEEALVPPSLKVKRVDHYYSKWSKGWKYRNTSSKVTVETLPMLGRGAGDNDPWKDYLFVPTSDLYPPKFKIVIKSEYILKACKDVIQSWPGISWNSDPLELDPEIFLTFLEEFTAYRDDLASKKVKSDLDKYVLSSVTTLLDALHSDYKNTIKTITRLKSHREITYDELYSILVPRTLFVARCAVTNLPRIFKLMSWMKVSVEGTECIQLNMEAIDLVDKAVVPGQEATVGRIQACVLIKKFKGTVPIESLDVYPLRYHREEGMLREAVLKRGRKWVGLIGVHHKEYDGVAAVKSEGRLVRQTVIGRIMVDRVTFRRNNPNYQFPLPVFETIEVEPDYGEDEDSVYNDSRHGPPRSRVRSRPLQMAPRPVPVMTPLPFIPPGPGSFGSFPGSGGVALPPASPYNPGNGGYLSNGWDNGLVQSQTTNDKRPGAGVGTGDNIELTEEELLLTPTVVYGFSLADKLWLEFSVDKVTDVNWNDEAFANLVLPADRKLMLQSLVEAHHRETFDDFIKGKGHGLVINLFGPTGVGKTFSAEATSEHVRRPLYIVGAGDLGTDPARMDMVLEKIFDLATAWKAIVLIDEADVFMEQRSLHDLERNAMVAVFLRHVEYYRGILFLTTNRVKAFDEAFLSRIHVALHFHELPFQSKIEVWTAFLRKIGALASGSIEDSFSHSGCITPDQIRTLAQRNVNGRQIKNAVRTAQSMAAGKGERLCLEHFMATLDGMEGFMREFEKVRAGAED